MKCFRTHALLSHGPSECHDRSTATGFTLVELLVAASIALVAMGTLATLLGLFTRSATSAQNVVAVTHRMRAVGYELRRDLAGVTCRVSPPLAPESDSGYFEIIEGPMQDAITYDASTGKEFAKPYSTGTPYLPAERITSTSTNGRLLGDIDDVLALTTRSLSEPFTGRCYLFPDDTTLITSVSGSARFTVLQSRTAEVAWFCQKSPNQIDGCDVYDLHRRQLLVMPYVGVQPFLGTGMSTRLTSGTFTVTTGSMTSGVNQVNITPWSMQTWSDFFGGLNADGSRFYYDVSVRRTPLGSNNFLIPNSLGDLTKRENRFWRWNPATPSFVSTFPHPFLWGDDAPSPGFNRKIDPKTGQPFVQETVRQGEDVVLSNVISFDVRVFDPDAPIKAYAGLGTPLTPGDPGYNDSPAALAVMSGNRPARGAYVDLGWDYGNQGAASFVFPIHPAGSTGASGFSNVFPGGEDRHQLTGPGGPDDANGNGRLDSLTAFQGLGMQPWNRPLTYPTAIPPILSKPPVSYCTWSTHYESNGNDDDGDGLIDEGNDGLDNNGDGIPDDPAERETSPPYPVPLRGIEVRIRCIEPTTKEIRQITIRHALEQD